MAQYVAKKLVAPLGKNENFFTSKQIFSSGDICRWRVVIQLSHVHHQLGGGGALNLQSPLTKSAGFLLPTFWMISQRLVYSLFKDIVPTFYCKGRKLV